MRLTFYIIPWRRERVPTAREFLPPSLSRRVRLPIPSSLLCWRIEQVPTLRAFYRSRVRAGSVCQFRHPSMMEPPEEFESPSSILLVWRLTSQPRRHWLLAETRRLERPYGVNRDGLASRFLTYSEHISIKNKARLRFRIKSSLHRFAACAFKLKLAEGEGFDPPCPFGTSAFKADAFANSAIPPKQKSKPPCGLTPLTVRRRTSF